MRNTVRSLVPLAVGTALALELVAGLAPALASTAAQPKPASVYVVQGVAGATLRLDIDGRTIASHSRAKDIIGPLELSPGQHTLRGHGSVDVASTFTVQPGASLDVVVHRQVDPSKPPVSTTFPDDLTPLAQGTGRVSVTHTAAVGPADIRVDGKVLFSNVASGESLSLVVPAKAYTLDIVPTAAKGPVVFGPTTLPVKPDALTRVFAIGVAANGSMDAVVQVLPVRQRGTSAPPSLIQSGTGGQAAALIHEDSQTSRMRLPALVGGAALCCVLGLRTVRRLRAANKG